MNRKIYNQLVKWKNDWKGSVALLIDGARRVGKSWIAEEFGKKEYRSYIIIDFNNLSQELLETFEYYTTNLDDFFQRLSLSTGIKLYVRESLIIFDEVQQYPKARGMIKYLVKDGRYDYLETGSLISINKNVKGIVIPSEEIRVKMYPMDFEEFMWALDKKELYEYAFREYTQRRELRSFHRQLMDLLRTYLIIGGMPQAVEKYLVNQDFSTVDLVKRNILALYRNDIEKYSERQAPKILKIFDNIPAMLQKHDRRFHPGAIKKGSRSRDYIDAMFWLQESMVANFCYAVSEPGVSLSLSKLDDKLKIYMGDTGLLLSMAFDRMAMEKGGIYQKIILNKLEFNKGMLIENFVAQQLIANGHPLFYYSSYSRKDKDDRMEIDFLARKEDITNRHNINAIEVKSSNRYSTVSLNRFAEKFSSYTNEKIVFHTGDLKIDNNVLYLPLYMAGMI